MFPLPTARAQFVFAMCLALHVVGLLGRSPWVALLASGALIAMGLALALTVPAARSLRAQGLEFGWTTDPASGPLGQPAALGRSVTVRGYFRFRGPKRVVLFSLQPALGRGLVLTKAPLAAPAAPMSRTEFELQVTGVAVGRWVIQGLSVTVSGPWGLFLAPLYFPTPLALRVLPQPPTSEQPPLPALRAGMSGLAGPASTAASQSTELRELRELQPGEAYRSIAWKASARRGRWLAREMESEPRQSWMLLLDCAGTMRQGPPGAQPLDCAIAWTATLAHMLMAQGDPVGLVTVDGRPLQQVDPGTGMPVLSRIFAALADTNNVVDADLTAAGSRDVERAVARYLRRQDDLGANRADPRTQVQLLVQHAEQALRQAPGHARYPRGETRQDALLRRFCYYRGIELPYRKHQPPQRKVQGLIEATRSALATRPGACNLILLIDPVGIQDVESLGPVLSSIHHQGGRTALAVPEVPGAEETPHGTPWQPGAEGERLAALRQTTRLAEWLRRQGLQLTTFGPQTPPRHGAQGLLRKATRPNYGRNSGVA